MLPVQHILIWRKKDWRLLVTGQEKDSLRFMKIPDAKHGMETIPARHLGEVRSLKEVILKLLLDVKWFPDHFTGELMSCLVPSLPSRLNLFFWCQKTLQQHCWNDCHGWRIVFSWFSWSSHLWWAFVYSMHAAGILLDTIQVRTHVHLAFARQQSLIRAQRRLRLTMQHVCGHSGTLGHECADHAAALGTFGLISYHNVATRLIHHNLDACVFVGCDNISEFLERLQHIRTDATSFHHYRCKRWFLPRVHRVLCAFISRDVWSCVSFGLSLFPRYSCFPNKWLTDSLHPRLPYRVLTTTLSATCGILFANCCSSSRPIVFSPLKVEVEARNLEKKNSDIAFQEINQ